MKSPLASSIHRFISNRRQELYPLLDGDRCQWLAADFDGPTAVLDALAYLKAARTVGASAALEVSHSTGRTPAARRRDRPYVGEGFDCPALDTLIRAAPVAFRGRLVHYTGRILRAFPGKTTAEVHDYHDVATGVLAASLAKRAPGYTSLGFPDPRRLERQ